MAYASRKMEHLIMHVHIGCSGWFYWHWKGLFYPSDEPTHRWFKHYTSVFKTVELNAPFYRWPQPSTVKGWKRNTPPNFRYSVKVNQLITHEKRMVRTKKLVQQFCSIAGVLGPQMGCFLFQFPPSYKYTRSRLNSIITQIGAQTCAPCAIEFRHKSWWRQTVYRAFRRTRLVFCSVSGPRLPEELVTTSDVLYLRFHGRDRWYRYDYSPAELRKWAGRIAQSKGREVWVYFNNDREGFAIKNAKRLRREIQNLTSAAHSFTRQKA